MAMSHGRHPTRDARLRPRAFLVVFAREFIELLFTASYLPSAAIFVVYLTLVPFIVIRFTGPIHRHLLVVSLGGGALFVAAADLVARLAIQPIEIPVGLVTAAVGGPVFLWLLTRRRDA